MYTWIWRKLPFGLPGKLIGSALLIGGATALLWFVAFPAVHQWMPFNQSTVDTEDDGGGGGGGGGNEEPDSDSDRVDDDPEDYELEESPTPDEEDGESGDGD